MEKSARRREALVIDRLPPRQALTDDVYEAIKTLIMDAKVEPGRSLTIDTLARELGVSQTPVREALARLESDDLVHRQGMRGYFATHELSGRDVEKMYAFRLLVEPWAAGRAAERASKEQARSLAALVDAVPAMPKSLGYRHVRAVADHDALFHGQILDLADNEFVTQAFERSHCFLHLFRLQYNQPETLRSTSAALDEHKKIAKEIAMGNALEAAGAMTVHLDRALERILHLTG